MSGGDDDGGGGVIIQPHAVISGPGTSRANLTQSEYEALLELLKEKLPQLYALLTAE